MPAKLPASCPVARRPAAGVGLPTANVLPSAADRIVKVRAYLTDERFGHTHWCAMQFLAPAAEAYAAVLVICRTEAERRTVIDALADVKVTVSDIFVPLELG